MATTNVMKAKRVATGQSRLDDDYFAIETSPEQIVRKKVSLDEENIVGHGYVVT